MSRDDSSGYISQKRAEKLEKKQVPIVRPRRLGE